MNEEQIREQLKNIVDPELNVNIVDLGLIYKIELDQPTGKVAITMTLTSPGCPLSFVFEEWIPIEVKKVAGVQTVVIHLVWEPPWDSSKITDDVREQMGLIQ